MPTARQYQNLVIASLSAADPPAQTDLQSKVPLYWSLFALKARWPDIRFWYTYRESVMFLMGRMRMQFDQVRRSSRAAGDSQADSVSDGNSVSGASTDATETGRSTSTHNSIRRDDGSSSGNGSSNFTSRRLLTSDQHHDDVGSGNGSESSYLFKTNDQSRQHFSTNDVGVKGVTHRSLESGNNTYQIGRSSHIENDNYSATTRLVEADTDHVSNKVYLDSSDRIVTGFISGFGQGGTQTNADGTLATRGHVESSTRFDARVDDSSNIIADPNINQANGSASLVEHSSDVGSVHGTTALVSRTDTAHHGAGSTVTRDSTVATSHATNQGVAHFQMQKLQQKMLHLDELWKEATKRIKTLEQQAVVTERYQILAMTSMFVTDFPDSQMAMLANTPALRNLDPTGVLTRFPLV